MVKLVDFFQEKLLTDAILVSAIGYISLPIGMIRKPKVDWTFKFLVDKDKADVFESHDKSRRVVLGCLCNVCRCNITSISAAAV